MKNLMAILFANDDYAKLGELTFHRATASLPIAGRYRLVDFSLSSFVNSGITKVGIITKNNYSSLMDHIRMGRDWDLNRKNSGIAVFPPFVSNNSRTVYKGKIDALEGIVDYFDRAMEDYVVIADGNILANIDYNSAFKAHIDNKADVTVLTHVQKPIDTRRVIINKKSKNLIKEVLIETTHPTDDKEIEMSLNAYIIKKDLLVSIINKAYARGLVDFEHLILQEMIGKLKVYSYKIDGFVHTVDDINTYYDVSMMLLKEENKQDLFFKHGKIFTKVKDSVPVHYGEEAKVSNSLIADGCIIDGIVENSILFRGVKVEKGAYIKNSIIMEHTYIGADSKLSNVIADKDVIVKEKRLISGHETYPVVIAKGKEI